MHSQSANAVHVSLSIAALAASVWVELSEWVKWEVVVGLLSVIAPAYSLHGRLSGLLIRWTSPAQSVVHRCLSVCLLGGWPGPARLAFFSFSYSAFSLIRSMPRTVCMWVCPAVSLTSFFSLSLSLSHSLCLFVCFEAFRYGSAANWWSQQSYASRVKYRYNASH